MERIQFTLNSTTHHTKQSPRRRKKNVACHHGLESCRHVNRTTQNERTKHYSPRLNQVSQTYKINFFVPCTSYYKSVPILTHDVQLYLTQLVTAQARPWLLVQIATYLTPVVRYRLSNTPHGSLLNLLSMVEWCWGVHNMMYGWAALSSWERVTEHHSTVQITKKQWCVEATIKYTLSKRRGQFWSLATNIYLPKLSNTWRHLSKQLQQALHY